MKNIADKGDGVSALKRLLARALVPDSRFKLYRNRDRETIVLLIKMLHFVEIKDFLLNIINSRETTEYEGRSFTFYNPEADNHDGDFVPYARIVDVIAPLEEIVKRLSRMTSVEEVSAAFSDIDNYVLFLDDDIIEYDYENNRIAYDSKLFTLFPYLKQAMESLIGLLVNNTNLGLEGAMKIVEDKFKGNYLHQEADNFRLAFKRPNNEQD